MYSEQYSFSIHITFINMKGSLDSSRSSPDIELMNGFTADKKHFLYAYIAS